MASVTYADLRAKQKKALDRLRKDCLKDEIRMVGDALKATGGNVTATSRALDVSTAYLWRRINDLGLVKFLATVRLAADR
jgi:transcriptional regulator with PAS, ATPase and Fis domain